MRHGLIKTSTPLLLALSLLAGPAAEANPPSPSGGIKALYPTKAEAEAAAKQFHCTGAHPMGNQWMPCNQHAPGTHDHP